MKINLLKYFITAFYLCSTFVAFAQPGTDDSGGTLEGSDAPAASIDGYIWVLTVLILTYAFLRLRSLC